MFTSKEIVEQIWSKAGSSYYEVLDKIKRITEERIQCKVVVEQKDFSKDASDEVQVYLVLPDLSQESLDEEKSEKSKKQVENYSIDNGNIKLKVVTVDESLRKHFYGPDKALFAEK